mmetsp:Transcript_46407/g.51908  ORF Transcript_46407/g.51908 Transcript_46407/m.51908 type:complete len:90 (-) Transcript_46407:25-294(-)
METIIINNKKVNNNITHKINNGHTEFLKEHILCIGQRHDDSERITSLMTMTNNDEQVTRKKTENKQTRDTPNNQKQADEDCYDIGIGMI